MRYPWPGNVRELEHVLESEVTLAPADKEVLDEVPAAIANGGATAAWPQGGWGWPWPYPGAPPWWPQNGRGAPAGRRRAVAVPDGAGRRDAAGDAGDAAGDARDARDAAGDAPGAAPVKTISDTERDLLVAALTTHRGRIPAVARALGVSRGTVYNKMRKFNLDPDAFR